jgi:hypothetical protein
VRYCGFCTCQSGCDLSNYYLDRVHYGVICESKDLHAQAFEEFLADSVLLGCIFMDRAIYLNNKARFDAEEINNEISHCMLTAKLVARYLPTSQAFP